MRRRFFDADKFQAMRKLAPSLKALYFYVWSKCDSCGVYDLDPDYMRIDMGQKYSESDLLKLPGLVKIAPAKFFFTDFININYGQLKENYNPHKPVFRDLEKNKISFSSLIQACPKLEEEEEYKEEGKEEDEDKKKAHEEFCKAEHVKIMALYSEWVFKRTGTKPKITPADGKAVKDSIIPNLLGRDKPPSVIFDWILRHWDTKIKNHFFRENIKLPQIASNLINILENIKNGKSAETKSKDTKRGSHLEALAKRYSGGGGQWDEPGTIDIEHTEAE